MIKPCIKCGATDRYADGRCRPCALRINRQNYERDRASRNKQQAEWYANNRERERNKRLKWRMDNLEKHRELSMDYARRHPEKARLKGQRYRERHPERSRESVRKYQKAHPDQCRADGHNYRARKRKAKGRITAQDHKQLLEIANHKCLACGTDEDLTIDHVIPLIKGGRNSIENTQVLCRSCNSSKYTKIKDYRKERLGGWRQIGLIRGDNG